MAETNETIADIIAEMRIGVNALQKYGAKPRKRDEWVVFLATFADRIESAYKRERATTENSSAVGNAAKLRKALVLCRDEIADLIHNVGGDENYSEKVMKELMAKCNAALAAPARNCDRFVTEEEARRAWFADEVAPRLADIPLGHAEIPFDSWLFVPAKEGGSDGSK